MKSFSFWKVLKVVITVAAVFLVLSGVFFIYNYFSGLATGDNLEVDYSKTTISEEQANNFARQLYLSMAFIGVNKSKVASIVYSVNDDDLRLIFNKFGKRFNFIRVPWYPRAFVPIDLCEFLQAKLSDDDPLYAAFGERFRGAGLPW